MGVMLIVLIPTIAKWEWLKKLNESNFMALIFLMYLACDDVNSKRYW